MMLSSTANLVNKLKENTRPMILTQPSMNGGATSSNLNTSQYLNTTGLDDSQTYQQLVHNMTAPLQRGLYGNNNHRGTSQGPQY